MICAIKDISSQKGLDKLKTDFYSNIADIKALHCRDNKFLSHANLLRGERGYCGLCLL